MSGAWPFLLSAGARPLDAGVIPDTLGADMHGYNTEVPAPAGTPHEHADDENHPFKGQARFSLAQAMSSMIALGLPLEDGRADGDEQPRQDARPSRSRRRADARVRGRRHGTA